MILDDGGDATLLVHKGAEYEGAGGVPSAAEDDPEEWRVVLDLLRRSLAERDDRWTVMAEGICGVTEETTGVYLAVLKILLQDKTFFFVFFSLSFFFIKKNLQQLH